MFLVVDVGNTNIVLGIYKERGCSIISGSARTGRRRWTSTVC